MSGGGRQRRKSRARKKRKAMLVRARKPVLIGLGVAILIVANIWVFRRQFPSAARRANAAYDTGLRAFVQGDDAAAERDLRACLDAAPRRASARTLLAMTLARSGRADEAMVLLESVGAGSATADQTLVLTAELLLRDDDFANALQVLRRATATEPTPAIAHRMLGHVLARTGDREGALAALTVAVATDRNSLRAWLELGDVRLASAFDTGSRRDRQGALDAYTAAERLARERLKRSSDPLARLALAKAVAGAIRSGGEGRIADAAEELGGLVASAEDPDEARLTLAEFHRRVGDLGAARDVLERALRARRQPDVFLALSQVHAELGSIDEAFGSLRQGLREHPAAADLHARLAKQLIADGRNDAAATALDTAVAECGTGVRWTELRGDLARSRARVAEDGGDTVTAADQRREALAQFREAVRQRPRSMPLRKKLAAEVLEGGGTRVDATADDLAEARSFLEDVTRINPGDPEAAAWLAQLFLSEGDAAAALALLQPFVQDPDADVPINLLRVLGAAHQRRGELVRAADIYLRALDRLTLRVDPSLRDDRRAPAEDWIRTVETCLEGGYVDLASAYAKDAAAAWPGRLELPLLLARAQRRLERFEPAVETLRAAVVQFPDELAARSALAATLVASGDPEAAEATLRTATEDLPGDAADLLLLDLIGRQRSVDEAEQGLRALLDASAEPNTVRLALVRLHLAARPPQVDLARAEIEQIAAGGGARADVLLRTAEITLLDVAAGRAAAESARSAIEAFRRAGGSAADVSYLEAKRLLALGRDDEARQRLEAWQRAGDVHPAGLCHLALARRRLDDLDGARDALEAARRLAPEDPVLVGELDRLGGRLALAAFARGEPGEAVLVLSGITAERRDGGAAKLLAAARLATGARAEALDLAQLIEDQAAADPQGAGDPLIRRLIAAGTLLGGRSDDLAAARSRYATLVDGPGSDDAASASLAGLELAHDASGALERFRTVVDATGDPGATLGAVTALVTLDRVDEAPGVVTAALARRPNDAPLLTLQGDVLLHLDRPAEAAAAYSAALRAAPPTLAPLLGAAASLAASGALDAARELLTLHADQLASSAAAWTALADLHLRVGDREAAGHAIAKARAADPKHPLALYLAGRLAEHEGDLPAARRLYGAAIDGTPPTADALARRAALLRAPGELASALELLREALALRPDDPVLLNNFALLLARDPDRLSQAVTFARSAHDKAPKHPAVSDTYGWLLVRSGQPEAALPHLRRAAEKLAEVAEVQYHAGVAAARVGEADEARQLLRRALGAGLDEGESAAARRILDGLR